VLLGGIGRPGFKSLMVRVWEEPRDEFAPPVDEFARVLAALASHRKANRNAVLVLERKLAQ
jgi:hypothetical protein